MLAENTALAGEGGAILYYAVDDARAAQAALANKGATFGGDARCIARVGDKDIWLAVTSDFATVNCSCATFTPSSAACRWASSAL